MSAYFFSMFFLSFCITLFNSLKKVARTSAKKLWCRLFRLELVMWVSFPHFPTTRAPVTCTSYPNSSARNMLLIWSLGGMLARYACRCRVYDKIALASSSTKCGLTHPVHVGRYMWWARWPIHRYHPSAGDRVDVTHSKAPCTIFILYRMIGPSQDQRSSCSSRAMNWSHLYPRTHKVRYNICRSAHHRYMYSQHDKAWRWA